MAGAITYRSPLALALLGDMVSPENYLGTGFGLLNSVSFLGSVAGPPITGWVRDAAGSFSPGSLLATLVAIVGAGLVWRCGRLQH